MDPRELEQIGPYPVVRFVAEGGMAWVFEVTDPRFEGARRACKVLKPEFSQGPELELFKGEIEILMRIDHPNVVRIWDWGQDDATDLFYYTMTYVDGPNFKELVDERGALDPTSACDIFLGVLAGLEQIHALNRVHRDISARNLMLASDDRAVVMDLGIARETSESDATKDTTVIRGAPLFMSPEQSHGKRPTKASDVFSLGLVFYLCLRGQTVYDETEQVDASSAASVRNYLGYLVVSKGEYKINLPGVPGPLREVVRTACRVDPRDRYRDAAEMRKALRQALHRGGPRLPAWAIAGGAALAAVALLLAAPYVWPLAREGWDRARDLVVRLWPESWPEVREEVVAAQGRAASAGCDLEVCRDTVQEGDALFARGDERFRAGSPKEAEGSYTSALEAYGRVLHIQPAFAAQDAARASLAKAESAAVELEEYRRVIQAARASLAGGDARLGEKAWSDARVLYEQASHAFGQAAFVGRASKQREAAQGLLDQAPPEADVLFSHGQADYKEERYEDAFGTFEEIVKRWGHLPRPARPNHQPELKARKPAPEEIVASRQKKLAFAVEVADADGDEIKYRWSVAGDARAEEGPKLELGQPTRDVEVAVTATDGKGGEITERWKVELNDAPVLTLTPGGSVTLKPNEKKRYTANATDPDGGALRTEFLLGDRKVASGEVYEFETTESGTFTLSARVTDDHGAIDVEKRQIQVGPGSEPTPDLRGSDTQPVPPTLPTELRDLLSAFVVATESCDRQKIRDVWVIGPDRLAALLNFCDQWGPPETKAEPAGNGTWALESNSGWICMKFQLRFGNGGPALMPDGLYKGKLAAKAGRWQFEETFSRVGGCS